MHDRDYLTIGAQDLRKYGTYLFGNIPHVVPVRDVETVAIPGRTGDLHIDNNRWNNVEIEYQLVLLGEGDKRIDELLAFLLSLSGYQKIRSTKEPDYYRLGRLVGVSDYGAIKTAGVVKLTFDCMPQKWLNSGEEKYIIKSNYKRANLENGEFFANPTIYDAFPVFHITLANASDTLTVEVKRRETNYASYNDTTVSKFSITNSGRMFDVVDCYNKVIYSENSPYPYAGTFTFITGDFPVFAGNKQGGGSSLDIFDSNDGRRDLEASTGLRMNNVIYSGATPDELWFTPNWWTL